MTWQMYKSWIACVVLMTHMMTVRQTLSVSHILCVSCGGVSEKRKWLFFSYFKPCLCNTTVVREEDRFCVNIRDHKMYTSTLSGSESYFYRNCILSYLFGFVLATTQYTETSLHWEKHTRVKSGFSVCHICLSPVV